ncbi:MAG: hypothetical protein H6585_03140 [Flavobacteriales bacterium]|nr:hypothetical protein [Flavobacteriales bacterium]MCB9447323.1 hypothetical protein [Flavobacteriales bacterium]
MQARDIHEVITLLEGIIADATHAGSPLGYFPALYKRVTVSVRDKINAGYFDDGPRMERLDTTFANRYLAAYDAFHSGRADSPSWQLAFEAAGRRELIVLQHLFAGMNAHIGLDLAIAAAAVAPGDSIYQLKGDFFKINEVLGNLVNTVQDELSVIWPMMRWIDRIGKRMDESLAIFSMDVARDAAWQLACELAALPDQAARDAAIAAKDVRVTAFGGKLINPGFLLNVVRVVVRLTERGNVPHKISTLNA